ncbi:hypothetical protein C8R45DRAFT_923544 [Mycena sanguinolenta]|nr:hypothetical protein C8R45DRAFT_923544 [Mycena sanguinolenta]
MALSSTACVVSGNFMLKNFQGHVLDLAAGSNPIITFPQNNPQTTNQMWTWGNAEGTLILVNVGVPGHPVFYNPSLPDVSSPAVGPTYMQLFVSADNTNGGFFPNCTSEMSGSFTWLNTNSGLTNLALTAWGTQTGDSAAPVTLEVYTGRAEQTWTVVSLD